MDFVDVGPDGYGEAVGDGGGGSGGVDDDVIVGGGSDGVELRSQCVNTVEEGVVEELTRKELEKEYTALKTKENEDQIELRRLRTENKLLRQRIEHLEKESATLADHLVQDQVTRAQEAEEVYALRNELSVTKQQLMDTRGKLLDAQDIIGDIKKRTRIIEDAVYLDQGEEQNMVKHLQEELIAVRLRETETADIIKGLKVKIHDLEDTNQRLQRAPSNDVQQLQEELIAVKLREAEANLSLKELKMKVNEIEKYWEAHMDRMRQASPQGKGTKTEIRQLQEEVVTMKTKEAKALIEVKEVKQKLMEMETQNHIVTNQIRRMGEDNKEIKRLLEEAEEREKDLKTNLKDLTRKLDDTESRRKEEGMMSRINEAESVQQLAELRHKIAEVDIQKEELLAACKLLDKSGSQDLENRVFDLQDEILKVKLSAARHKFKTGGSLMTDSFMGNNSDEEVDAEINDSKNLDKTLSDIIEGRSPSKHDNLAALATTGESGDGVGNTDRTSNGGEGDTDLKSSCDSDGNFIRQSSHTCKNTDTRDDEDEDGNVVSVCGSDVSSSTPAMSTPSKGAKHSSLPPVGFDSPQGETTTVIKSDNCDEDVISSRLDDDDDDDDDRSQQKSEGENLRDVDGKNMRGKMSTVSEMVQGSNLGSGSDINTKYDGGDKDGQGKNRDGDGCEGNIGESFGTSGDKESLADVTTECGVSGDVDDFGDNKHLTVSKEEKQKLLERWELYDEDDEGFVVDGGFGGGGRESLDCASSSMTVSKEKGKKGGALLKKGVGGGGGSVVVIPKSTPSECGDLSKGFVHGYHSQRSKSSALLPKGVTPKSGKVVVIKQEGKKTTSKKKKNKVDVCVAKELNTVGVMGSGVNCLDGGVEGLSSKQNKEMVDRSKANTGDDGKGMEEKLGQDGRENVKSSGGLHQVRRSSNPEAGNGFNNSAGKRRGSEGGGFGTRGGGDRKSLEEIPDIEVIYEPSCFKKRLSGCLNVCGEEEGGEEGFLKESSV